MVGSCYWNEEQESYRPEMAFLPVGIFEDADAVYIAPQHYFELAGERHEGAKTYYDECNQITNSLEQLREEREMFMVPFWKLVVEEIHDEDELDSFIKARYFSGCSLGEQSASNQDGVYDVQIQGDGLGLDGTCPMNYGYKIKYFPSGGRVIAWNTGQAPTFLSAVDWSAGYDFEMIESFQFLNVEPASTEASSEIPAPTPSEEEEVTRAAEIISLDETWNQYTNYELGFSIKFPKEMAAHRGSCYWNEEQGSYRPEMAFLPVQIFEDADAVYIAPEHYFDLAGERVEENKSYYDECNQITNSLELLRDHEIPMVPFWKLVTQEVRDEGELEGFIKARYFSGCSLGEQVASAQEGVFDVKILGDGKDLAVSQCPMNYGYVVKYFPSGGRVIAWNTGQAYTFLSAVDRGGGYDFEMIESFRFLTETPSVSSADSTEPDSGWTSYVNTDYGFSLQYPATWTAAEVNDEEFVEPGSRSVQLSQGTVVLVIGYRHLGENYRIGGGGGGGEFEARGTVSILDHDVPRQVVVYEGKDKAVYYTQWSGPIAAGELEFSVGLHDFMADYSQIELPQSVQDEADQIVESLELAPAGE
jgi:hypothetical protein